ncbi:cysteine proteinase [Mytilinidion resinicola]|uniref:ubiquitinyl hydrolase 1 n=1 Tax=Mytilinidion resinicola TaxID=574789 RepID=A0A6A6YF90_9PEZI|nr:cysteine proteinase [Mytilinidion resinicola]KAF2806527.1 cysteine proteinase [Mytilinidion resinicola]
MAWERFVDLVPERLIFALDPSSNPYSNNSDAQLEKPENMQATKSEVLRKALRLDGLGLFKSPQSDGPLRGISTLMKGTPSDAPPGLGNWDNSCYQNSVIQGLASLPSLKAYLTCTTSEFPGLSWSTTNGALFDTISRLHDHENFGQRLWTPGKLKSMSSFQQQDAQEYYSKILDELDKEILKALKDAGTSKSRGLSDAEDLVNHCDSERTQTGREDNGDSTPTSDISKSGHAGLQNPLDGLLAQRVGCINCGYTEGLSMIPFNCITVPLGREWVYDVRDCLSEYTKLEYIEGVDCAKCSLLRTQKTLRSLMETQKDKMPEGLRINVQSRLDAVTEALDDDDFADSTLIKKCQVPKKSWVSSTKSRQAVIARPPKALVIHVNRSVFDELTGAQMKNYAEVRFPKDLDLGPWCLGSRSGRDEEWTEDPNMSMIADLDEDLEPSPFKFTLRAVVTHYGRHENGHYICYRKHPTISSDSNDRVVSKESFSDNESDSPQLDQSWWRLSDEDVSKVSESHVLGQGGVFMLFYERCESDPPPPSQVSSGTAIDSSFDALAITSPSTRSVAEMDDGFDMAQSAAGVPLPEDEDDRELDPSCQSYVAPSDPSREATVESTDIGPKSSFPLANVSNSIQSSQAGYSSASYPTSPPDELMSLSTSSDRQDLSFSETNGSLSSQMTSDDDVVPEADCLPVDAPARQPLAAQSPAYMRTAGTSGSRRNNGSRSSLPMVAAT